MNLNLKKNELTFCKLQKKRRGRPKKNLTQIDEVKVEEIKKKNVINYEEGKFYVEF